MPSLKQMHAVRAAYSYAQLAAWVLILYLSYSKIELLKSELKKELYLLSCQET